jgi:hypothetical protein
MKELEIAIEAVRLYAESHPRPVHVTQIQAAKMLSRSRNTISRMISSGELKLNRCGMIPIWQIDQALSAHDLHTKPRKAHH